MATKKQVLVLHEKYPALSASDIADLLECNSGWVRSTARRNGLWMVKANYKMDPNVAKDRADQFISAKEYIKSRAFAEQTADESAE